MFVPVVLIVLVMSFVAVLRRVVRLEDMTDCFGYLLVSGVPAVVKCLYEAAAESALAVCIVYLIRRFFQVLLEVVLGACAVHCWRTSVNAAAREVSVSCVDACCRLRAVRALPAAPPRRSSRSSRHGCPSAWLLVMRCGEPESKSRAMLVFGQCGAAVL